MTEEARPPVAIRISRPQANEDDLLEQELETITRTGVTLLGAQPRAAGLVLRFEIVLASGLIALRGEGRVVGFKPNFHQGLGGLTLRFTRLDSKSKALVDKATALRDKRRPSLNPAPSPPAPPVDLSPGPSPVSPHPPPATSPSPHSAPAPLADAAPQDPVPSPITATAVPGEAIAPADAPPPPVSSAASHGAGSTVSPAASLDAAEPPPASSPATNGHSRPHMSDAAPTERPLPLNPRASSAPSAPDTEPAVDVPPAPTTPHAAVLHAEPAREPSPAQASPGRPLPAPTPPRPASPAALPSAPSDRDALLERLRTRAKQLDVHAVQTILTKRTS